MLTNIERDAIKDLILKNGTFINRCGLVISYPDILDIIELFTEREVNDGDRKEIEEKSQEQQMDEGTEQESSEEDTGT